MIEADYKSKEIIPIISVENEVKALYALARLCTSTLEKYTRTLSENEELRRTNLTWKQSNALEIVIEEQIFLRMIQMWVTYTVSFLEMDDKVAAIKLISEDKTSLNKMELGLKYLRYHVLNHLREIVAAEVASEYNM